MEDLESIKKVVKNMSRGYKYMVILLRDNRTFALSAHPTKIEARDYLLGTLDSLTEKELDNCALQVIDTDENVIYDSSNLVPDDDYEIIAAPEIFEGIKTYLAEKDGKKWILITALDRIIPLQIDYKLLEERKWILLIFWNSGGIISCKRYDFQDWKKAKFSAWEYVINNHGPWDEIIVISDIGGVYGAITKMDEHVDSIPFGKVPMRMIYCDKSRIYIRTNSGALLSTSKDNYLFLREFNLVEPMCRRKNKPEIPGDGSFEHWLHGGHLMMVRAGLIMSKTYKTYPGLGEIDDHLTVFINPCFQEADLKIWLDSKELLTDRVIKAIEFAKRAHRDQKRDDGSPYLEQHVYPVAGMILWMKEHMQSYKEDMIILALLHDVLEHSNIDEREIKKEFGEEIYNYVKTLTKKRPWEKYYDDDEYIEKIKKAPRNVRIVKLASRLNNVFSLVFSTEEERMRYLKETEEKYLPIAKKTSYYFSKWYRMTLNSMMSHKD